MIFLSALIKKAKSHVEDKKQNPLQLDIICLQNGQIYVKKNYRPYKAAKHITQDDSIFNALLLYDLFIYPGGINPRVRYDKNNLRRLTKDDFETIKIHASDNYSNTIKHVKNQLKTPLADKNPVVLRKISQIFATQDNVIIEDSAGSRQLLKVETVPMLLLVFDTEVVDLTETVRQDPMDMLFGVQLGGGTDINKSVNYCTGLIENPKVTAELLPITAALVKKSSTWASHVLPAHRINCPNL